MSAAAAFIRENLRLMPVPGLAGVSLYTAHSGSRLSRLGGDAPPFWAYPWGGGLALARYVREHPECVSGRSVLDLGAGSGLVGIVAALAGAEVCAAEIDPFGQAAVALNAEANDVEIALRQIDIGGAVPAGVELVLAGDVFYDADIAARMLPFLERCRAAGMEVLIGDPGRRDLPVARLRQVAEFVVGDVGEAGRVGRVYVLRED